MPSTTDTTAGTAAPPATRRLPRPIRRFLDTEAASGLVLLGAALVALVWANSPWKAGYRALWHTQVAVGVGDVGRRLDLRHVVNEGLMAVFFLVVGVEVKRELVAGELRRWRTAALPAFAALGGMVVPAAIFLAGNRDGEASRGWGVPTATDVAFAVGALALLGPRVPSSLKVFLLSLAIVDDIGAIAVIAVFYSGGVDPSALAVAGGLLVAMGALRRLRVAWVPVYVVLAVGVWAAVYESGAHATLAGVALGLLTPARPLTTSGVVRRWAEDLGDDPSAEDIRALATVARSTVSVADRLEHLLHPATSFVVVPLFALANAGIAVDARVGRAPGAPAVLLGVGLGLVVGKLAGVTLFSWLAVRCRLGALPEEAGWGHVAGVGALAGVGFTVSLFVAGLAFARPSLEAAAKLGILAGSTVACGLGLAILSVATRGRRRPGASR